MAKHGRNLTFQKIAIAIGVSVNTVRTYVARGCPRNSIAAVKKWRSANIMSPAIDSATNLGVLNMEIQRAKICDLYESSRSRKQKNDAMEKRLIDAAEHKEAAELVYRQIRVHLQALGVRCENAVPAEFKDVIKQLVDDRVANILKEADKDLAEL